MHLIQLPDVLLGLFLEFEDQALDLELVLVQLAFHEAFLSLSVLELLLELLHRGAPLLQLLVKGLSVPPCLLRQHVLFKLELFHSLRVRTLLLLQALVPRVQPDVILLQLLILLDGDLESFALLCEEGKE